MAKQEKTQRTLLFPTELFKKIQQAAADDRRTVSNHISVTMEKYLKKTSE